MEISEITLREAIEKVEAFCPVQIIFNDIYLYNDYGEDVILLTTLEDGTKVWGENRAPIDVIPDRLWQFDKYVVTELNIEIVEYHHSVVTMRGKYQNNESEV